MDPTALLRRLAAHDTAGSVGRIAAAAVCVAFAMTVRFAIEPLLQGQIGYATYFPAVILAALWAGRRAGAVAIALSVAAVWAFIPPYFEVVGGWTMGAIKVVTFGASAGVLVLAAGAFRDALRELDRRLAAEVEFTAALKAGEARFRAVFDSGALGMAIVDMAADGPVEVNDRFLQIAGIDRATWAAGGWSWREATPPEDLAKDEAAVRALVETGRAQTFEKSWTRPDGDRVRIVLSAALMPEFPGLAVVTVQDVSEMRKTEDALRESERALQENEARLLLALQAGRMIAWDADLVTGEFNRSANAEELLGETEVPSDFYARIHPEDRDADREAVRRAVEDGASYQSEYRYPDPNGGWMWLHNRAVVERDASGKPVRFTGVAVDVTARRNAEAALAESERRFRAMADSAPTPIWVSGADGGTEYVNRAYLDFYGLALEDLQGFRWLDRVHPADVEQVRAIRTDAVSGRKGFDDLVRIRRADGRWRWLSVHARPRLDETGSWSGLVGISFDVTEAREAQAELERSNDKLEERVVAALQEKEAAEAALLQAQKLEAIGRLTGGVAHDFNNLLTVVIGALDVVLKHGDDAPRRARMAEAALLAARRGERLTQQLLAFARRQSLRPEVCDVSALVLESEPILRRAVGDGLSFEVETPSQPLHVRVDRAQFEAALLNLVVNARDATPDGGQVRVSVWSRFFGPGEVGEGRADEYVCVEVSDTGAGMTPDVLARVFEPFFTTKAVGKGTGLGLAQVYGFARQSGGDADVFSEPGRGARIALRLPRVGSPGASPARPDGRPSAKVEGLRVLVVEDDPAVGALAETLLADAGCLVVRELNAAAALERLAEPSGFDVLLTDVVMPGGMNGVELARRAAALRPDLSIVLTSGYVGEALDDAAAHAPWPLLSKPYTAEQLLAAVALPARASEPA